MTRPDLIPSIAIAIGLAVSGWFVGHGIVESQANERFVTVKGLAERMVVADRVAWPISFVAANNDLTVALRNLNEQRATVLAFLEKYNIAQTDTEQQDLRVLDQYARSYNSAKVANRYLLQQTILVRTDKILAVAEASQNVTSLLETGVLLGNMDGYGGNDGPTYIFTGLNDIKPDMIAEATANARLAAAQFAKDAGTGIQGILRAQQGRFEVWAAEDAAGLREERQIHKKVRVVTTLDYVLGD